MTSSTHAEQRSIAKLRAAENARKVSELLRSWAVKIRAAEKALSEAQKVYELLGKEDVPALIKARQEILALAVRWQVLIECWEEAAGAVWVRRGQ